MAFVALALLGGCSKSGGDEAEQVATKSELSIGLPIGVSRTAVDAEGRASWVEGDTFALWAENATGGLIYDAVPFEMMYYWHWFQSAVFTSTANGLAEGNYTYYAVSPKPESKNGFMATYTIPADQQGASFNGAYDIMVASPVEAEALSADKVNSLPLDFKHKMHLLKVTIAENNLSSKVKKLVFTFPSEVTGKVTVDASNPDAAPVLENASRNLTINCGEGVTAGDAVWGVIFPQTISGDVKITAVGLDDTKSQEKSISISKNFAEGHITPLALTIPRTLPTLRFTIGENNLGESIEKFTITDHNGNSISVAANNENEYDFVVTEEYGFDETIFDHYEGKTFKATFESRNAIVSTNFVMPSELTSGLNIVPALTVPYLFFEDFSSIHTAGESYGDNNPNTGGDERQQPGVSLDGYMSTKGWNAARFMLGVGACPRINARYQKVIAWASQHYGRLDSPAISGLKPGANVTIKVTFDLGGIEWSGNNTEQEIVTVNVVKHTNATNPINGIPAGSSGMFSQYSTTLADFGVVQFSHNLLGNFGLNSFNETFPTYSGTISGVTNATRLCFYPKSLSDASTIGNMEVGFYIDNIKVSIAQ